VDFFDKLGNLAKNIGDKATDAIEISKLNGKISAEKSAIDEKLKAIGEIYYQKHLGGAADDPEVAELFAGIDGHHGTIAEIQAEIERVRAETAAKQQAEQSSVPEPEFKVSQEEEEAQPCPACGAALGDGAKFCPECGAKIIAPAPENKFCPECGEMVAFSAKFCGACGHRFE
jgi:membrane protease subunit (stomatin/prohibitin family)